MAVFFRSNPVVPSVSSGGREAYACRFHLSSVDQPCHSLLPNVWSRGVRFITDIGG